MCLLPCTLSSTVADKCFARTAAARRMVYVEWMRQQYWARARISKRNICTWRPATVLNVQWFINKLGNLSLSYTLAHSHARTVAHVRISRRDNKQLWSNSNINECLVFTQTSEVRRKRDERGKYQFYVWYQSNTIEIKLKRGSGTQHKRKTRAHTSAHIGNRFISH